MMLCVCVARIYIYMFVPVRICLDIDSVLGFKNPAIHSAKVCRAAAVAIRAGNSGAQQILASQSMNCLYFNDV